MGSSEQKFKYRGLKLIEKVMKVMEHVVKGLIRQRDKSMRCSGRGTPGRGTKYAVLLMSPTEEAHDC